MRGYEGHIHLLPPAKIVCGCGNQEVLSEVVKKLTLEHYQVANNMVVPKLINLCKHHELGTLSYMREHV